MKRTLMILLAVLFIFSAGCSSSSVPDGNNNSENGDIVVYNGLKNPEGARAVAYLEYLETNKGIKINIEEWDITTPIKDLNGLLKIDLDTYRTYFADRQELFLPLNDILASNVYACDIPDGIMNAVTDEDGNIWGFLISHDIDYLARSYNDEAIRQLEVDIPRTPGEFMNFLIQAKEELLIDAITVVEEFCAESFYDVFAYYNCPVIDGRFTIGWDEDRQMFMDHAITDEMVQSIQFIKELDEAGLISYTSGTSYLMDNALADNKCISVVTNKGLGTGSKHIASGFTDSVFYLEYGSEEEKLYEETEYNSIYVIPAGTTNASSKVDKFIETFYSGELLNKIGEWGIDGENFIYISSDIINDVNYKKHYEPRLSGWWIDNRYYKITPDEDQDYYMFWNDNFWPEIKTNFYNGVYTVLPIDKSISYNERSVEKMELHNTFNNLLFKFIVEDMTVEEFFDEYKNKMTELGVEAYIEGLN